MSKEAEALIEAVVVRGSFRGLDAAGNRVEYVPAPRDRPPTVVKVTEHQLRSFSGVLARKSMAAEEIEAASEENMRTSSGKEATDPPAKEAETKSTKK